MPDNSHGNEELLNITLLLCIISVCNSHLIRTLSVYITTEMVTQNKTVVMVTDHVITAQGVNLDLRNSGAVAEVVEHFSTVRLPVVAFRWRS